MTNRPIMLLTCLGCCAIFSGTNLHAIGFVAGSLMPHGVDAPSAISPGTHLGGTVPCEASMLDAVKDLGNRLFIKSPPTNPDRAQHGSILLKRSKAA